jgi:hypothetical protein
LGLDSRELTPTLVGRIAFAAAETRSDERASIVLKEVGGHQVSRSTVQRVVSQLGSELAELRDETDAEARLVPPPEAAPALAVVECDGGRIRTRVPGQGPGVHEAAWRETKNACLLRMSHQTFGEDPHPELPRAFCDPQHVAKLAEMAAPPEAPPLEPALSEPCEEDPLWPPQRLVRTCLSSMADAGTFGGQMKQEARQRRFFEASHRAFLGDGLPWNWSIWKKQFSDFIPILDFVHVLAYLYAAAIAMQGDFATAWLEYLEMARAGWQGRLPEVLQRLQNWLLQAGVHEGTKLEEQDPRSPVADALRYLTNNRERMDYPRYRRLGLPVTTALMESLVKQINYRVKGTEMFWNDPTGAEAILQLRAAALCDDRRLQIYLATRPGCPYVRRSSLAQAT